MMSMHDIKGRIRATKKRIKRHAKLEGKWPDHKAWKSVNILLHNELASLRNSKLRILGYKDVSTEERLQNIFVNLMPMGLV